MNAKSYSCLQDVFSCGPAKYGFDAPGGGQVCYWAATFEVVSRVFRVGTLDAASAFFFQVLDKRRLSADARTIDDEPQAWEWRDERGLPCEVPAEAKKASLATHEDYHGRILPALKKIEESFFASFDAQLSGDASNAEHYSVKENRWVKGPPA